MNNSKGTRAGASLYTIERSTNGVGTQSRVIQVKRLLFWFQVSPNSVRQVFLFVTLSLSTTGGFGDESQDGESWPDPLLPSHHNSPFLYRRVSPTSQLYPLCSASSFRIGIESSCISQYHQETNTLPTPLCPQILFTQPDPKDLLRSPVPLVGPHPLYRDRVPPPTVLSSLTSSVCRRVHKVPCNQSQGIFSSGYPPV